MKKELKAARAAADEQLATRGIQLDSEGRAVITLTANDDSDFLSPYSENDTPVITEEVAEIIRSRAEGTAKNAPLTVRIKSSCIDEEEKVLYRTAIKEYFTEAYIKNETVHKKNRFTVVTLSVLGILVLGIYILLSSLPHFAVWSEVVNIVAWVLLWEAVDIGVFHSSGLRHEKNLILRLLSARIEYVDL